VDIASKLKTNPAKWDRRTIARLISEAEANPKKAEVIVNSILPFTGNAYVIGITGPPGCGKSTLINKLALQIRKKGKRVGIIAIDATSPFSGGAFMGNRVRMREASQDSGIFIRSMSSKGSLSGLSLATSAAIKILDAAGIDCVIIETVGAGQMQTEIASTAYTVVVVLQPESGDIVQALKAGLMEIGDIFAINKSDLEGADKAVNDLTEFLSTGHYRGEWVPEIVRTIASRGKGVVELAQSIERHRRYLESSNGILARKNEIVRNEVKNLMYYRITKIVEKKLNLPESQEIFKDVVAKRISAYDAAKKLMGKNPDREM
jgi:LAO/AO transport system kinase